MATFNKLPSGRWRVQIRKQGVYRARTFDKKGDGRTWATEIERQIDQSADGGLIRPTGLTLGHIIDMHIEAVDLGHSKRSCLNRLRKRIGKTKLHRLTTAVRDFVDSRVAEGVTGATIAEDLSFLSSTLDWARHVRHIDVNPETAREARRGLKYRGLSTRSTRRTRLPTDAELEILYQHWRDRPPRLLPMETLVRFALASGFRLGEICRIVAEDVDHDRKTVVIRQRKDPRDKANNDQTVPLVNGAWEMIEARCKAVPSGRLFPYRSNAVSLAFWRACKATGIEDLRFHDLRHAATVQFFRMGLDIPRVALITGHKSWEQLRRYANLQPEDVHNAISSS